VLKSEKNAFKAEKWLAKYACKFGVHNIIENVVRALGKGPRDEGVRIRHFFVISEGGYL